MVAVAQPFAQSLQRGGITGGKHQIAALFGEDQARYVVAVAADTANWLSVNAEGAGVPFRVLGQAGGNALTIGSILSISVDEMKKAHESWFPDFMAAEFVESADAA